jgi:hypothetical protein
MPKKYYHPGKQQHGAVHASAMDHEMLLFSRGMCVMAWKKRFYVVPVESSEADVCVLYSHFPSEFDVQRELYDSLFMICDELDNGSEVKSEVTAFCDDIKSRFDLMIFKKKIPVCAVEVKRHENNHPTVQSEKQTLRYEMFSRMSKIPVLYCEGIDKVEKVSKRVKKIIS